VGAPGIMFPPMVEPPSQLSTRLRIDDPKAPPPLPPPPLFFGAPMPYDDEGLAARLAANNSMPSLPQVVTKPRRSTPPSDIAAVTGRDPGCPPTNDPVTGRDPECPLPGDHDPPATCQGARSSMATPSSAGVRPGAMSDARCATLSAVGAAG
jgi:hypothetical protein